MVAGFADMLATLESADFFIGVLPFIITYAVFFLTLRNSPKFKEDGQGKKMSIVVSLSVASLVSYYVVSSAQLQTFFLQYFGTLTIGLMLIMGLFVAFALTGLHKSVGGRYFWAIPVILIVASAWVTAGGFAPFTGPAVGGTAGILAFLLIGLNWLFDTGLIWAILIIGAVAWASSEGKEQGENGLLGTLLKESVDEGGDH